MNLWDIQSSLVSLLTASANLSGAAVIADDGTYPKTPNREEGLATKGLVIIVGQINGPNVRGRNSNGFVALDITITVLIEENPTVNRSGQSGASGVVIEKALAYVVAATIGKTKPSAPIDAFRLQSFDNLGLVNGVLQIAVNFGITQAIKAA